MLWSGTRDTPSKQAGWIRPTMKTNPDHLSKPTEYRMVLKATV
jgi:hypothetical protein